MTAEAARFVGRQDPSVPAQVRDAAFKAPKPAEHQPVYEAVPSADGGAVVLGVMAVRVEAAPTDKQQISEAQQALATQYSEDDGNAYVEQARKLAKVQKNTALFDQQ